MDYVPRDYTVMDVSEGYPLTGEFRLAITQDKLGVPEYRGAERAKLTRLLRMCVPLPPDGAAIFYAWCREPYWCDGITSGVLADWMDEHADALLDGRPRYARSKWTRTAAYLRARVTQSA